MKPEGLKLIAQDEQDMQVLAAVLQDAIVPVCDMAFEEAAQSFVMVVHRFRWDCLGEGASVSPEGAELDARCYERVCCALEIAGVESVKYTGFDQNDSAAMLDLLTIMLEDGCMVMIFAGGGKIRLKVGEWRLRLEDFGESWPVKCRPSHPA